MSDQKLEVEKLLSELETLKRDAFNEGLEVAAKFMEGRNVSASPFYAQALREMKRL